MLGSLFHFETMCTFTAPLGSIPVAFIPTAALWPHHLQEKESGRWGNTSF